MPRTRRRALTGSIAAVALLAALGVGYLGGRDHAWAQSNRRLSSSELRKVLDAAEALLAEMPVEEISLRELGRRLGVSKTHVVRYFESREGVFLELTGHALRE